MTINQLQENGKLTLVLEGRLDTATAPQLQYILIPAIEGGEEVTLDFSKLLYVSSAGLRVLLVGQKTAKARGASMKLANVLPDVMEVFDMTGFSQMLNIL